LLAYALGYRAVFMRRAVVFNNVEILLFTVVHCDMLLMFVSFSVRSLVIVECYCAWLSYNTIAVNIIFTKINGRNFACRDQRAMTSQI